jgi:putative DNA primase/helicase
VHLFIKLGARYRPEGLWAFASQNRARLEAMIGIAKAYVEVSHDELDTNPWLMTVGNGTLDLRTGEFRPHDPRDLNTKMTEVDYRKGAKAPTFHAFLEQVLPGKGLRGFVQRVLGYSLTEDVSEQILPFFYGTGSNGKSTLVGTVLKVAGDYGQQAAPDLLMVKKGAHPTELADLFAPA